MWNLLIPALTGIIDKIIPDTAKADEAKAQLLLMQSKGELDALLGQLEINKVEAKSSSVFVSGARPFILWTCGVSFGYATLMEPLLRFVATVVFAYTGAFPVIDTTLTMQVLLGLLGLGGLRTLEKTKGVARQ